MKDSRFTQKTGTMTSEGFIPHLYRNGVNMPVLLDIRGPGVKGFMEYQRPQRGFFGRLLYALPGGKIYTEAPIPTQKETRPIRIAARRVAPHE